MATDLTNAVSIVKATKRYRQAQIAVNIAKAIEAINRERKPILKIVNRLTSFSRRVGVEGWLLNAKIQGLNIALHDLEQSHKYYMGLVLSDGQSH